MVSSELKALSGRRVVALGGGHGLHATLSALRLLTDDLTAVVTVADDGGSSGRIRRELGLLPPGDLRMALTALAGQPADGAPGAVDPDAQWADLLQKTFAPLVGRTYDKDSFDMVTQYLGEYLKAHPRS